MGEVADTIADVVVGEELGLRTLGSLAIKSQIRQHVVWSYSPPEQVGEQRYAVKATATGPLGIDILLVRAQYDISADFDLVVDIELREVAGWEVDRSSFDSEKR